MKQISLESKANLEKKNNVIRNNNNMKKIAKRGATSGYHRRQNDIKCNTEQITSTEQIGVLTLH